MSSLFALLLVLAAVGAVGTGFVVRRRRHALGGLDWYRAAGVRFARDHDERVRRYTTARKDAEKLADALRTLSEGLTGRFRLGGPERIADELKTETAETLGDLFGRLDARELGINECTIVLYGRTKAGKSSLLCALTGRGRTGIGDGRQNFTRELHRERLGQVVIVDSPGVSGVGSRPLEEATEHAVHEADVLVAVVTDDALFKEDFDRLAALGESRRPTILALNVKSSYLRRLVEDPGRVFRKDRLDPHIGRLREHLPPALNGAPIVPFHARAAAEARDTNGNSERFRPNMLVEPRNRRHDQPQNRRDLWDGSRISGLIEALAQSTDASVLFARDAADEAISICCSQLRDSFELAGEEVDARLTGCERAIKEIEGILSEIDSRRGEAAELLDDHFSRAEEDLLEALNLKTLKAFRRHAAEALRLGQLREQLTRFLEACEQALSAKFEEFRTDVRLAGRVAVGLGAFEELHGAVRKEQDEIDQATKAAKKRKWFRLGAKAAGAVAVLPLVEFGPGGLALGAVAVDKAVDVLLPEVAVPPEDAKGRIERVRALVADARSRAEDAVTRALENQVIDPARKQLVEPLESEMTELRKLAETVAEGTRITAGFGKRAAARQGRPIVGDDTGDGNS